MSDGFTKHLYANYLSYLPTEGFSYSLKMNRDENYGIPVPDYLEENVSTKVVKIIQSYTGVVDKMVWRKEI